MKPEQLQALQEEVRQMVDQTALGDEEIRNWVNGAPKRAGTISSIIRLPGDASTRRYYRVETKSGQSYIIMRVEPFSDQEKTYPFLRVQEHLLRCGIDVPQVLDVEAARGFVLLEDLGDVTLLRQLQDVSSSDVERHIYERVIDSLILLQHGASKPPAGSNLDAFKLRFDHEKLMWEVNFCIENFYQGYLKRKIRDADMKVMQDGFSEICQFLADQPTVLTHRDFHSRNVMVAPGDRLVMIDFQDARLGPAQYDLASLLRDSYYQLEEAQIRMLINYYVVKWEAVTGKKLSREEFFYVFDMMSVQRNFKAIGSFASFVVKRGDPGYLKYIGNTFENIRRTLLKYPKYSNLREVLFHYYYF